MRDIYFWKEKLEGRDKLGEGGRGEGWGLWGLDGFGHPSMCDVKGESR